MNLRLLAFWITFFLTPLTSMAQRNCGTMHHYHEQVKKDPEIGVRRERSERIFRQNLETLYNKKISNSVITIPVVVHVVYNTAEENISNEQIESQIDVLNEDFQKLNSDSSNVPPYFQPSVGDAQIQFVLAKRTPDGSPTTGITRTLTSKTSFSDNDEMKFTNTGGMDVWDPSKYLNIWVCNLSGGILGYAQFPNEPPLTDGVVIGYKYFGLSGPAGGNFNLGRTATHEIGHYLNLYHIWGDESCGDDEVKDTPEQKEASEGCPEFPHQSCNNEVSDMFMNYMDYVHDACMVMFSKGQVQRMRFAIHFYRPGLATSDGATPPGAFCDGQKVFYEHSASISDGSGSSNYLDNSDCKYLIQPPAATSITLSFTAFSLSAGDVLNVYDGDNTNANLLGSFTGNTLPSAILTTGGSLLIHFISNSNGNSTGWSADYTSIYEAPNHCNGPDTLTVTSGIITDGSSYEYYQPSNQCSWLIKPALNQRIRLHFEEFEAEKNYDFLQIYDGEDQTAPVLADLTGFEIPNDIVSSGNRMFIQWTTDQYVNHTGFKATYTMDVPTDNVSANSSNYMIYPNPANTYITIQNPNKYYEGQTVKIINLIGETIMEGIKLEGFESRIDLSKLEPGLYYVIITDSHHVTNQKLRKF